MAVEERQHPLGWNAAAHERLRELAVAAGHVEPPVTDDDQRRGRLAWLLRKLTDAR